MQTVDICILVLLALPAIVGVLYGFLNIVFSIVAWTLASVIAVKFGAYFTPMLASLTETVLLQKVLAFIGVFIISLMILTGIAYFIMKLLGRTGLTGADRILGLFFGFALGGFIVAVIIFMAGFTALPKEQWWRDSIMIEPFQVISDWGHQFLPEDFANHHGYETEQIAEQPEEAV
ncbi:MAG: CvpA family protein [Gammaproteobacteria bacterium]|jgi:membrane protein required for colicin V production|nr:CvpA family protein [Gammaproteobacteria bacterium]